jgi:hypothetical protein
MPHSGNCFYGTVKLEVTGSPEAMGYCHCSSCRSWSGGPVNAFNLWKPDAVRITAGAEPEGTNMMLRSPRATSPTRAPRARSRFRTGCRLTEFVNRKRRFQVTALSA